MACSLITSYWKKKVRSLICGGGSMPDHVIIGEDRKQEGRRETRQTESFRGSKNREECWSFKEI